MSDSALDDMRERLFDDSYRREYGAANARYELALALVKARRKAGLTQKQLSELVGVSQAYIAKLESGEANPTIGNIGAMLAVMWLRPSILATPLPGSEMRTDSKARSEDPPVRELAGTRIRERRSPYKHT